MRTKAVGNVVAVACYADGCAERNAYWRLCLAFCVACCLALMVYQPMWAATFEVDSELDGVDSNIGNVVCLNVLVEAGGACTLRAAIQEANFTQEPDTINLPAGTYTLTIENLQDNAEDASATGDLDITSNIIITGAGAKVTIIAAKDDLHDRVLHLVGEEAVVALNGLTIRNGNTTELNGYSDGGGISVNGGKLDGLELVVSDNTALNNGGGIMILGVNSMLLNRCTISGNSVSDEDGDGGGVYLGQNYSMTLVNCTISDNEAGARGGGINIANNSGEGVLLNTTVANNRLRSNPEEGGGLYIGNNTEVQVLSSIIANNFAQGDVANDCYGQFDLLDFSFVEVLAPNDDCVLAGDGENVSSILGSDEDPLLGSLSYYQEDDQLQTHALLLESIAIDAGNQLAPDSGGRSCDATDARGQVRPARAYCDMGSFELPSALYMPKLVKST